MICKILNTLKQEFYAFKFSWLLLNDEKGTVNGIATQLCHEWEIKQSKNVDLK